MKFPQTPTAAAAASAAGASTFAQLRAARLELAPKSAVNEFFELYAQLTLPFQQLLDTLFEQPGIWSNFVQQPSSKVGHHRSAGGNLRHTLEVVRISLALAADPACHRLADRNVQIVVALLHDIGKTCEYEAGPRGTQMSPLGRLVGHKFVGFGMVWNALHSTPGITEHQRLAILNCLSNSPQGWGSGVRGPACLEAQILHHADQLSAASDLFRVSQEASPNPGFGVRHPHQRETPYHVRSRPSLVASAAPRAQGAPAAAPARERPSQQERLKAAAYPSRPSSPPTRRA